MSSSLIIVLIIVVWLFVLAPLLMRGQKPIRKAGEAFDDTRVIHQGGTGDLPARRRPRLSPADVRPVSVVDEDLELIDVDEVLIDDIDDDAPRSTRSFRGLFTRRDEQAEVVEGAVVHELEAADVSEVTEASDAGDVVTAEVDDWDEWDEEATYAYDDTYTSPSDLMYPDSVDSVVQVIDDAESADAAESAAADSDAADQDFSDDLSEEEIEFAEHRAARGGWDPVADAETSTSRYQRRQRTLLGLAGAVVLTGILAFVVGGWTWLLAGVVAAATVLYLVALRTQVREEQALRNRRIRQLRRARLGVLSAADEELAIPSHLRRPGAVILERDDESPDFDDLPIIESRFEEETVPAPRPFRRPERFSDDRRAG
ncbi:gephyrin-like molybdotransferase receptor GlpR [Corynebacterium nasicanis]|uniref:Gephyrin-like molybdotransferase receptor GlpR n=1 Tax=Corynebacterium nasicanis TaxID=1448267 RepID=A0ABW1QA21_9CORY